MKTNNSTISKLVVFFTLCFLMMTSITFSQKNNQKATINKGIKVLPKVTNTNCDCNAIDFKVRIIKGSSTATNTTYKLQLIDFENAKKCDIKFITLNWKGHSTVPFKLMKNKHTEEASDGSVALYEFEFESKINTSKLVDESSIITSCLITIGGKNCLIENKPSVYFSHM